MQLQQPQRFEDPSASAAAAASLSRQSQSTSNSDYTLNGAYPSQASSASINKMQHPHLQSPYQTRTQPLPSSTSSANGHGGAFQVRDLQQSLDEQTMSASSSNSNGGWSNAHASSSSSNINGRAGNNAFTPNGRESPSKTAALASRMQNLSSPPPRTPSQQGYVDNRNGQASTSTPSARSSGATATPSSATPAAASARSRNPLIDLIDTEKGYVDDLGLVIKVGSQSSCNIV